jgi:hypothetical protein
MQAVHAAVAAGQVRAAQPRLPAGRAEGAAAELLLYAHLPAIEPRYQHHARDFALLEAGYLDPDVYNQANADANTNPDLVPIPDGATFDSDEYAEWYDEYMGPEEYEGKWEYRPPPPEAFAYDDNGNMIDPPEFNTDAREYQEWAHDNAKHSWIQNQLIDPFDSNWPGRPG